MTRILPWSTWAIPLIAIAVGWYVWQHKQHGWKYIELSILTVAGFIAVWLTTLNLLAALPASEAASKATQRSVWVKCPNVMISGILNPGYEGWVPFNEDGTPSDITYLKTDTCATLRQFQLKTWVNPWYMPNQSEMLAIHILAHEVTHLKGNIDEGLTECKAHTSYEPILASYGSLRSAEVAYKLDQWYTSTYWVKMPGEYYNPACRPDLVQNQTTPVPAQ